ncbi:quinone oxidoreductase family protein [Roseivirga pacifica]|uniref:quinone oxidoreductase family protein n=1 Tax=Roseivirga pacifica TaxID=1267423 RepID=UPI003BAC36C5
MKSLKITNQQEPLQFVTVEKPTVGPNQVLVQLKAAALNRRDQWIREGKYPGIQMDVTLGSDGAGLVAEVGAGVSENWLNREVIINPNINWGSNPTVQSVDYTILGMPTDGTLAEYVLVDADRLVEKPAHLNWEEAAALPLGGLTAFRATFHHGQVSQDKNVLISGVGGGVAQFTFLYAVAAGANVYVTSGQDEKIAHCEKLGAKGGFNYKTEGWQKTAKAVGGFHTVIDSAGGNQINDFIKLMKPAGRIVFYGATNGMPEKLDVFRMFWNQITLQGATMGNDNEFTEMISFINQHKIHPIIDSVRPFDEAISAFDAMKSGRGFGKLVLVVG